MRVMAVDYGDVQIGLAVSDALLITAQSPRMIRAGSTEAALEEILRIAGEEEVSKIVVGLPRNMDGSLGEQARKVMEFGTLLESRFEGKVHYWDERLSTRAATRVLIEAGFSRAKRKKLNDGVAALILLQNYLDSLGESAQ